MAALAANYPTEDLNDALSGGDSAVEHDQAIANVVTPSQISPHSLPGNDKEQLSPAPAKFAAQERGSPPVVPLEPEAFLLENRSARHLENWHSLPEPLGENHTIARVFPVSSAGSDRIGVANTDFSASRTPFLTPHAGGGRLHNDAHNRASQMKGIVEEALASLRLDFAASTDLSSLTSSVLPHTTAAKKFGRAAGTANFIPRAADSGESVETIARIEPEIELPVTMPTEAAPPVVRHVVTIRKGDSLIGILRGHDVSAAVALTAIRALEPAFNTRKLQIGAKLEFVLDTPLRSEEDEAPADLLEFIVIPRPKVPGIRHEWRGMAYEGREVLSIVDGVAALRLPPPTEQPPVYFSGVIENSFFQAAEKVGLRKSERYQFVQILEGSLDFSRDIRKGDRFEALVERRDDESILHYVGLVNGKRRLAYYRVEFVDDRSGYFDREGSSSLNLLDARPIPDARISSSFGPRIHPVRKVRHVHKGIDFRAAYGTPIPAAGNGVVVQKGWRGGYGRYLRVRHNGRYMTGYAHMKSFGKNIRVGARVQQGQIIGYVGSSGVSTGPHLHFEVIQDGRHTNPLKLQRIPAPSLSEDRIEDFQILMARVDTVIESNRTLDFASLR